MVRQDLPLVKPCWLSQITSLSHMCLNVAFSRIFTVTEFRLTGLQFSRHYFLPFLKTGVMLLFFFRSLNSSCRFIHTGLLALRLALRHSCVCSCAFKISILRSIPASWNPGPFRSDSQGTPAANVLNRSKHTLWKFKIAVLLVTLLTSPRIENSTIS